VSFEYALYEISYENFLLYSAAIPSFKAKAKTKNGGKNNEIIKADDPKNRELVKAIIQGYKF
jgi:hypothetical protein